MLRRAPSLVIALFFDWIDFEVEVEGDSLSSLLLSSSSLPELKIVDQFVLRLSEHLILDNKIA
jgi:hypothetical protein